MSQVLDFFASHLYLLDKRARKEQANLDLLQSSHLRDFRKCNQEGERGDKPSELQRHKKRTPANAVS